jgi:hypothetical protein
MFRTMIRRLKYIPLSLGKIMTLIRLIQRASLVVGLGFASLPFQSRPVHADTAEFCVTAGNGKTACGTLKTVETACVTTSSGATVCGKMKSAKKVQSQEQEEDRTPTQSSGYRKEAGGVTYLLRNCKIADPAIHGPGMKCNFVLTVKRDNQIGQIFSGSGNSSITDFAGNTYASNGVDYSGAWIGEYNTKMSAGIDYVVDLYFPIRQEITKLSLLNVVIANKKILQFRNISVSN